MFIQYRSQCILKCLWLFCLLCRLRCQGGTAVWWWLWYGVEFLCTMTVIDGCGKLILSYRSRNLWDVGQKVQEPARQETGAAQEENEGG